MAIDLAPVAGRTGELRAMQWIDGHATFDNLMGFSFFNGNDHVFYAPAEQRMWVDGRLLSANEYWGAGGESNKYRNLWTVINGSAEAQALRTGDDEMVDVPPSPPGFGDDDMFPGGPPALAPVPGGPGDFDPGDPGGDQQVGVIAVSVLAVATRAGLFGILRGAGWSLTRGMMIRWASLPGWIRVSLVALGVTEGFDILIDLGEGDEGWIELPFSLPGRGGGDGDPVGQMVAAMTVSTWNANGVQFHRLSDGRLAVRNKHGVWKIWRPKKPVVIMPTGASNLQDLLRADGIIQKQAKRITKVLRNRGWKVSRS